MALRLVCPICQESLKKDPACGHIFHSVCLDRWLREPHRQPSCPQCRQHCTRKQVIRLFVEESTELSLCEDIEDLASEELQDALSAAKAALKARDKEIEEMHQTLQEMKDDVSMWKQRCKMTAEDLASQKSRTTSLQKQLSRFLPLEQECVDLRKQLQDLTDRHTVIDLNTDDVSEMVERYGDGTEARRRMAVCLVSLKREYESLKKQRKDATDVKDRLAKQLAVERAKLHQAEASFTSSKRRIAALEADVQQMEEEKASLMEKLQFMEDALHLPGSKSKVTRFTDSSMPAKRPFKHHIGEGEDRTAADKHETDHSTHASEASFSRSSRSESASSSGSLFQENDSDDDGVPICSSRHENPRRALSSLNNAEEESMPLPIKSRTGTSSSSDLLVHRLLTKKSSGESASVRHGFNGMGGHSRFMVRMKSFDKTGASTKPKPANHRLSGLRSLNSSHSKQQAFKQVQLSTKEDFLADKLPDLPALSHSK